jgi:hypothetical protein
MLTIKDLPAKKELAREEMTAVRGGNGLNVNSNPKLAVLSQDATQVGGSGLVNLNINAPVGVINQQDFTSQSNFESLSLKMKDIGNIKRYM